MQRRWMMMVTLVVLVVSGAGRASTFKVGSDATGCTHASLAAALAAAEANGPGVDTIRVNSSYVGTRQGLAIADQSVRIVGGYASCSTLLPGGVTRLTGQSGQRLFTIAGYPERPIAVELRNLELSGGAPRDAGGGFAVFGAATVTVRNSRVRANSAERGGGVYVDGMGLANTARLVLDGSRIDNNLASIEGAGIYCRGGGRIEVRAGSFISSNGYPTNLFQAARGGGASLDQCSWYQTGGSVNDNRALLEGAGLYAANGAQVVVEWSATGTPQQPAISNNRFNINGSVTRGAAIAAIGPGTRVDMFGTTVSYNEGGDGAAFSIRDRAYLSMQRDPRCDPNPDGCSDLIGNRVTGGNHGNVVLVADGGTAAFYRTRLVGNSTISNSAATSALFELYQFEGNPTSTLRLHGVDILDNRLTTLFEIYGYFGDPTRAALDGQFLTLRGNTATAVIGGIAQANRRISLRASIIDEATPLRSHAAGALETYDCLLSRSALGTPSTRSLVADPLLDFQAIPQRGSPAIDFCTAEGLSLDPDLVNLPRGVDDSNVPDRYGPVDLGAVERLPSPTPLASGIH